MRNVAGFPVGEVNMDYVMLSGMHGIVCGEENSCRKSFHHKGTEIVRFFSLETCNNNSFMSTYAAL